MVIGFAMVHHGIQEKVDLCSDILSMEMAGTAAVDSFIYYYCYAVYLLLIKCGWALVKLSTQVTVHDVEEHFCHSMQL